MLQNLQNAREAAAEAKARSANSSGVASYNAGDYARAAECFREALEHSPNDAIIKENLANAEWKLEEQRKIAESKQRIGTILDEFANRTAKDRGSARDGTTGLEFAGRGPAPSDGLTFMNPSGGAATNVDANWTAKRTSGARETAPSAPKSVEALSFIDPRAAQRADELNAQERQRQKGVKFQDDIPLPVVPDNEEQSKAWKPLMDREWPSELLPAVIMTDRVIRKTRVAWDAWKASRETLGEQARESFMEGAGDEADSWVRDKIAEKLPGGKIVKTLYERTDELWKNFEKNNSSSLLLGKEGMERGMRDLATGRGDYADAYQAKLDERFAEQKRSSVDLINKTMDWAKEDLKAPEETPEKSRVVFVRYKRIEQGPGQYSLEKIVPDDFFNTP
jgi:tetratricopeptide (TPR) repeat protein